MLVRTLRRIQSLLAFAAPFAVLAAIAWRALSNGIAASSALASGVLVALVVTLAVCLRKRAAGRETAWFNGRIAEDPPGEENEPVLMFSADVVLVLAAVSLVFAAFWHAAG